MLLRKERTLTPTILNWKTDPFSFVIATGFGIGLIPGAPGTYASILTMFVAVALWRASGTALILLPAALATTALGIWTGTRVARSTGLKDPQIVVIDEIAGQFLTLCLAGSFSWRSALVGLVLFRFFDILKPFPARRAEALREGWGVVADDLIAGLYALLALWAISAFIA